MYHDTLHRRRQSVIFHVAHAGRLLSATLAFWNIDNVVERNEFNRGWVSKGLQKYLQRFDDQVKTVTVKQTLWQTWYLTKVLQTV